MKRQHDEDDVERLISLKTAARRLRVHPSTLRRWVRSGKLMGGQYPNGYFKVSKAAVDSLLEKINHSQP